MMNFNPFKDEIFSILLLLTSLTLTSACTGSNNSKTSTPSHSTPSHPTTQITPNFTTPGSTTPRATSYNGVPDTFERTQINRLKERGLTGRNVVIRLRDETHPDLRHPLLQHPNRCLPQRPCPWNGPHCSRSTQSAVSRRSCS
jgi:hypothetical protein